MLCEKVSPLSVSPLEAGFCEKAISVLSRSHLCSLHYLSLFYGFSAGLQGEVLPISQLETLLQGHLLAGDACIKA